MFKRTGFSKIILAFSLWALGAQTAAAHTLPIFLSLDLLVFFTQVGQSQSLRTTDDGLASYYFQRKHWESNSTYVLGAGIDGYERENIRVTTSLRYFGDLSAFTSGDLYLQGPSRGRDFRFEYQVDSDIFFVENAIAYKRFPIQPSFVFGLGVSSNRVSDYNLTPVNNRADRILSIAQAGSKTNFAYGVGFGLDYVIPNLVFEFAYRFIGAGEGEFGRFPGQTTPDRLKTNKLYFQTLSVGGRLYFA